MIITLIGLWDWLCFESPRSMKSLRTNNFSCPTISQMLGSKLIEIVNFLQNLSRVSTNRSQLKLKELLITLCPTHYLTNNLEVIKFFVKHVLFWFHEVKLGINSPKQTNNKKQLITN